MSEHMAYQIDKWCLGNFATLVDFIDSRYTTMEKYDLTIHCLQWMRGVHDREVCDRMIALAMINGGFSALIKHVFSWMLDEKEKEGVRSYTTGRLTVEDDPLGSLDIRVVKKDDEE